MDEKCLSCNDTGCMNCTAAGCSACYTGFTMTDGKCVASTGDAMPCAPGFYSKDDGCSK